MELPFNEGVEIRNTSECEDVKSEVWMGNQYNFCGPVLQEASHKLLRVLINSSWFIILVTDYMDVNIQQENI